MCIAAHFKLRHVVFIQRQKWSNRVKRGQTCQIGSNGVKLGQTGSSRVKQGQTGSNWAKLVLLGLKWGSTGVEMGSNGVNRVRCSQAVQTGQMDPKFYGPKVPWS